MTKRHLILIFALVITAVIFIIYLKNKDDLVTDEMRMMKNLGTGINIGNDLDVYGVKKDIDDPDISDYETFWGNQPVEAELFKAIKKAGFNTVRIPVTWSEHVDKHYNIDEAWMARVTEVVDDALDNNLYVILDTHHETFIMPDTEHEVKVTKRFLKLWSQIADNFEDYNERLLFEGMNEPRVIGSDEEWTGGTVKQRKVVNHLNREFVKCIRQKGGNNENRYLLVTPYASSCLPEALDSFKMPKHWKHVLVSIHAYIPYAFTSNEAGNNKFDTKNLDYTRDIEELADKLSADFIEKDIPVVITEFGCQAKKDEAQRIAWAKFFTEHLKPLGIPMIWWDDGGAYSVMDRETNSISNEELVEVIVKD